MVEGCGMRCIRISMFAFNTFFALMGLAIMGVGIHHLVVSNEYLALLKQGPGSTTWVIITGLVVFVISFLGCYGALCEKRCMMLAFGSVLLVILLLEIAATATVLMHKDNPKVEAAIRNELQKNLPLFYNDTSVRKGVDVMQTSLQCCGVDAPADWATYAGYNGSLPDSCCNGLPVTPAGVEPCTLASKTLHAAGCLGPLAETLNDLIVAFAALLILVMLVQVLAIAFAFMLARAIGRGYETV